MIADHLANVERLLLDKPGSLDEPLQGELQVYGAPSKCPSAALDLAARYLVFYAKHEWQHLPLSLQLRVAIALDRAVERLGWYRNRRFAA